MIAILSYLPGASTVLGDKFVVQALTELMDGWLELFSEKVFTLPSVPHMRVDLWGHNLPFQGVAALSLDD